MEHKHLNMKHGMLLFLAIALVMIVPNVMATSSYVFEQYSSPNLKVPCFNELSDYCDVATTCNITISNPSFSTIVDNQGMAWSSSYYSYQLNSTQTQWTGSYPVTVVCKGTSMGYSTFSFDVTSGGNTETYTGYILLWILIFVVMWVLMVIAIKIENEILAFFAAMGLMAFSVSLIIYGTNLNSFVTRSFALINIGVGAYILISSAYHLFFEGGGNSDDEED